MSLGIARKAAPGSGGTGSAAAGRVEGAGPGGLSEEIIQSERSAPSTAEFNAESLPGATPVEPELPPSQLQKDSQRIGPTTVGGDVRFTFRLETGSEGNVLVPLTRTPWHLNPHLDFVGSLPISKRQMKRAWRYNRRMRRVGAPVELDVEATIAEIYRQGIFLKPVLISRRQNQARILILIDERGR